MMKSPGQVFPSTVAIPAFALFLTVTPAIAQHGEAEPGYYPTEYVGDTWQGNATSVDDQANTITLTYTKGSKTQTFTVRFAKGLAVSYSDGTSKVLKPSDIPIGAMVMAYYTNYSEKVNGKKTDIHEAFMMRVKTVDGVEHHYKAPFDPTLKRWGVGGIQVSGTAERPE
jgi:hypothetical protein